jgi:hypothetical protein
LRKPFFNSPEAEGKYTHEIDWRGSPWYRIKWFLFGELNSLRTLFVVWGAVVLTGLGVAIYVIHHFIHKYW